MGSSAMKIYSNVNIPLVAFVFSSFIAMATAISNSTDTSTAILLRVDQLGKGDFKKIQDAIDAVPSNNKELVFIWVKPGTYREKIVVPADKPFITISGTAPSTSIITWDEGGDIFESSTFTVLASDFVARYLTIENTYGSAGKAVALRVSADRAAFYACNITSYQDTVLDDTGNHYYSNCYIEGATDFICGNAASLFERCHIHSLSTVNGSITAQRRMSPSENTGFTFLGCTITGVGSATLGRPWGTYSRVVYALTYMSSVIVPQGWDDWGNQMAHRTTYYGEYKNYGPGADTSKRVGWSDKLSNEEAAPFLTKDMIGGTDWLRSSPKNFKKSSSIIVGKN
ncbi:putative pectinesterase 11 [Mangifera indica]|uniref:putative pectinesterase 11 n=1 Tax=Mangifera indica TaxID=29780 RepID=UPI001CF9D7EC|nr:putative pectinesterase 11 [Mangifera indica]